MENVVVNSILYHLRDKRFCILTDPDANGPIFAVMNNLFITEQTVHLTLIPDDLYSNLSPYHFKNNLPRVVEPRNLAGKTIYIWRVYQFLFSLNP